LTAQLNFPPWEVARDPVVLLADTDKVSVKPDHLNTFGS
jgi:hypothetical protein